MNASNQEAGQGQKRIPTIQEMESWNYKQLLDWIRQIQPNIFCDDEDVVTFKAAKINGFAFSKCAEDLDFFREIHLPLGVYRALAALASEFSKQNDQPNRTAGQKRKGDETDLSEESPISKRRQKDKDKEKVILTQLATKANKRRRAIKDMITHMNDSPNQHSNSVDPLPEVVDKLSDPTSNHTLDFPFIGSIPERFNEPDITEGKWLYMGRTMFKDFLHEVKKVRKSRAYEICWLYGTKGFGKSHLLAALVCYFAAQDERVVYLPDCRCLLDDPVSYVKTAMLLAWADDFTTQKEIMALRTQDHIKDFFGSQENVIFVVDQMDVLMSDNIRNRKMALTLYDWVIGFTSFGKSILSSSANCTTGLEVFRDQNASQVVRVYGGFSETEMEQWWEQHKDIDIGGYSRNEVEDVTGCIPLLLNHCIVNRKFDLTAPKLIEISNESVAFARRIKSTATKYDWEWYCDYVKACIHNWPVPLGWTGYIELIDHRYFYQRYQDHDYIGRYACGIVRDAVANQLLELDAKFIKINFLTSLSDFIDNRSNVGFRVEYAILASIRSQGLKACGAGNEGINFSFFTSQRDIQFDIRDKPVLHRPRQINYETIDGMITFVKTSKRTTKEEKPKLFLFPLQITVRKNHSKSHQRFLDEYSQWAEQQLLTFDIELEFLWITPNKRDVKEHPVYSPWPRHKERCIPFSEVSTDIWIKYQEEVEEAKEEKGDDKEEEEKAEKEVEEDQRSGTHSTV
ncbi:uncharacterized protein Z518_06478 [Rhinocladiella mackenziei CBS 650.93]|uniref:Uncharacterized protein n=1 Tax=Rhinocladiella mackenziei CBS 650.93 TaxID=1442369 RepID=A0A0D2IR19_9EURO|nr:uncharacterized protein Z518_06478 [Rhinocladiella mackenziei CBS 650.93]KIX05606.1 hypothetical protein Z518_06478 [Rhinocladiella mackenziei CBS 650.93]